MTFPTDYHINKLLCVKKNQGKHQWSSTGHPLTHRCNDCHKLKWIHNNPLERGMRLGHNLNNANRI